MRVIGYLTSGYPTIEKSVETARVYVEGGCDMLEISIPLENNREKPFLNDVMKQAYRACPDYDAHMEAIGKIALSNPGVDITILLYNEVLLEIGVEKFVEFCRKYNIHDVNSANLTDAHALEVLDKNDIHLAGLVNYNLEQWRIEEAIHSKGFVYCQAFPREGQKLDPRYDTIGKLIPHLRELGIRQKIYCGGGIAKPEDAKQVKDAGADGFFLGSSIIALYDQKEKLVSIIRSFCDAVK